MEDKDRFLESEFFLKLKWIFKITKDIEFFHLLTNHLHLKGYLTPYNLGDYFNILVNEKSISKNEVADFALQTWKELKIIKDLKEDNVNYEEITGIDFIFEYSPLFMKIINIMEQTKDIEFFNLITNYLLDTKTLDEQTNLCFYFGEFGIRKLITHEDVGKWYLNTIHIDINELNI